MATIAKIMTAEELSRRESELGRYELVRGELIMMSPAKSFHGIVTMTIGALLHNFARKKRLGRLFGGEAGFFIERNPDTVRAPDVAFVHKDRLKNGEISRGDVLKGFRSPVSEFFADLVPP